MSRWTGDGVTAASGVDPLGGLLRWETAGGAWRTLGWRDGEVTVALLRCDGDEEVGPIVSTDPS